MEHALAEAIAPDEREALRDGATLVADALALEGWDMRFLGSDMPHPGVLSLLESGPPALRGISVTMLFDIPKAIALVGAVRERLGPRAAPGFWQEIGADAFAPDVRSVAALACG